MKVRMNNAIKMAMMMDSTYSFSFGLFFHLFHKIPDPFMNKY